jgi:hypothetical protein
MVRVKTWPALLVIGGVITSWSLQKALWVRRFIVSAPKTLLAFHCNTMPDKCTGIAVDVFVLKTWCLVPSDMCTGIFLPLNCSNFLQVAGLSSVSYMWSCFVDLSILHLSVWYIVGVRSTEVLCWKVCIASPLSALRVRFIRANRTQPAEFQCCCWRCYIWLHVAAFVAVIAVIGLRISDIQGQGGRIRTALTLLARIVCRLPYHMQLGWLSEPPIRRLPQKSLRT